MDQVDVIFTAQIVLFLVSLLSRAALVFGCICALRMYAIRNNLLPARLGAQGSMHDSLCVMQFSPSTEGRRMKLLEQPAECPRTTPYNIWGLQKSLVIL